jgi:hypothetical protein
VFFSLSLLCIFLGAADNVDFTAPHALAVNIINQLDMCQRGMVNSESTIVQLEKSIKTALLGVAVTGIPPPRPAVEAPASSAAAAAAGAAGAGAGIGAGTGAGGEAVRRASINFNSRDLAALRKKSIAEGGSGGAAAAVKSKSPNKSNAGDVLDDLDMDIDLNAQREESEEEEEEESSTEDESEEESEEEEFVDDGALPDGWVEKLDKKSNRYYYVNE